MQQVTAPRRAAKLRAQKPSKGKRRPPRDPAPSRLAYRMERLRLTPGFLRMIWLGLPLAIVIGGTAVFLSDQVRRDDILAHVHDIKTAIQERPEFMVRLMAIDGASDDVAHDIREVLPVDFPVSSFDLDLERMRGAVAALDPVARADIGVRPGGVLQVSIVEREPVVIWRQGDMLEMLDREGHRVADLARRSDRSDLPVIAGAGADGMVPEALDLLAAAGPLERRIRGLVRLGARRWSVVLDRDQRIDLPESGATFALEQVIAMDEAQDLLGRDVSHVDMRNPRRPTVRLGSEAVSELRRIKFLELGAD